MRRRRVNARLCDKSELLTIVQVYCHSLENWRLVNRDDVGPINDDYFIVCLHECCRRKNLSLESTNEIIDKLERVCV